MLIETYDVDVFTPPCDPGAERFAAKALLLADISEVQPYLFLPNYIQEDECN